MDVRADLLVIDGHWGGGHELSSGRCDRLDHPTLDDARSKAGSFHVLILSCRRRVKQRSCAEDRNGRKAVLGRRTLCPSPRRRGSHCGRQDRLELLHLSSAPGLADDGSARPAAILGRGCRKSGSVWLACNARYLEHRGAGVQMQECGMKKPKVRSAEMSRRSLLHGVAGAGLAPLLARTAKAQPARAQAKVSKEAVDYQDHPKGGERCDNCTFFDPPDACALVEGRISPQGWCRLWAEKKD